MPAHPDTGAWAVRLVLAALTLVWLVGAIWGANLAAWSDVAQRATTSSGAPDVPLRAAADLADLVGRPGSPLVWAPMITLSLLLLELGMGAFVIASIPGIVTRGVRLSYRVRVLNPINRGGTPEIDSGELWAALLTSMAGLGSERVALSLSRSANVPATLGVQLRGLARPVTDTQAHPQAPMRGLVQAWPSFAIRDRQVGRGAVLPAPHPDGARAEPADVATARRIIEGVLRRTDPTAQLEPWPDPLQEVQPGMVVVSQELTLAASPHWPLRLPEHDDGGVLRAMARALAVPAGVVVQEYQVIPTPTQDRGARRWYARAHWWLARLRRRDPLGAGLRPTEEMASLTRKMGEAHAVVTLRLVAVAASGDPRHVAAARTSLDVMRAALASMEGIQKLPLSTVRQRWVPITGPTGRLISRQEPTFPIALRWLNTAAKLAGAAALLLMGCLAATYATLWRGWGDLPGLARGATALVWGASLTLGGASTAWQLAILEPWVVLRRVGRRRTTSDPIIPFRELWRQPAILGAAEVGQLWRPPELQAGDEVSWTPNRILPAPASAFVPAGTEQRDARGALHAQWLTLGHAFDSGGQLRPVGVPLRALHQMMHITAGMGAGKTQAAAAMCAQLIPWGFIILDGKGDDEGGSLASTVRRLLPAEEEHRLFYLNVLETGFPIALNPIYHYMRAMEQASGKAERDLYFNAALGLILGLFERLDPGRWNESPGMQQYALMGSHLVLRTGSSRPGEIPTMAKVSRALEDETYRRSLIARYPFKNDLIYRFWTEREEQLSEAQKTSLQALLRRLDLFMANPITRPMLTGERPSVDLLHAMETGQIVIIPMPHRNLGGLGPLVGMLILQSIVAAAYARPGDAMTRETAPVFIDEVQVFVVNEQSPDLEQAFTQLRGFGVPLLVLHQTLDQLGALESTFCINAANRLILRTGEPDAATYARMYSQFGVTAEDIKGMEALHHQYAVTLGPNREQLVFSLRPNPWPAPPAQQLPPHLGGRSWQAMTAPALASWSPAEAAAYRELERTLTEIVYAEVGPEDFDRITGQLAQLPEPWWDALLEQWDRLRAYHYAYLLEHPGVEPDQMGRQTWLSKLVSSRGALIEEALILRQEIRMIHAAGPATSTSASIGAPGELVPPPRDMQPRDPGSAAPPPALPQPGLSREEVARGRGLRPEEKPEIISGLDSKG